MSHTLSYQHCSFFDGFKVLWAYTWTKCCIYSIFLFHRPTTNPLRGNKLWWQLASYTSWFDHDHHTASWLDNQVIQTMREGIALKYKTRPSQIHIRFSTIQAKQEPSQQHCTTHTTIGFTFYVYSYLVNELGLLHILLQCSFICIHNTACACTAKCLPFIKIKFYTGAPEQSHTHQLLLTEFPNKSLIK